MNELESEYRWLSSREQYITLTHEKDKVIIFERGMLIFVFNFHPTKSFEHYRVGTKWSYDHIIVLDTDELRFFGQERLRHGHEHPFPVLRESWCNRPNYIQMYIPSRTAIVLKPLIIEKNFLEADQKSFDFDIPEIEANSDKFESPENIENSKNIEEFRKIQTSDNAETLEKLKISESDSKTFIGGFSSDS